MLNALQCTLHLLNSIGWDIVEDMWPILVPQLRLISLLFE